MGRNEDQAREREIERDRPPSADDMRDHALNQIQTIAYDATLPPFSTGDMNDALKRILSIAEAQRPDEDWRPVIDDPTEGVPLSTSERGEGLNNQACPAASELEEGKRLRDVMDELTQVPGSATPGYQGLVRVVAEWIEQDAKRQQRT